MRSQRPRAATGGRLIRAVGMLTAAAAFSGCSSLGFSGAADSGPPRLSPNPQPEIAASMLDGRPAPAMRLNACELLDLTPARVIALTGADMPDVEPTGSGDLGLLCTYGGPGSPERYEAEREEAEREKAEREEAEREEAERVEAASGDTEAGATGTTATSTTTAATPTTADTDPDPDYVPDSVAVGVVKPLGGSRAALAGQSALLGARYACSGIRGEGASSVEGAAAGAPGAPAPVRPDLGSPYIDCVAAPTGGGVEVHTILVADSDLWHLTLIRPGTPRSPEAEARALAGLHRIANQILD